MGHLAQTGSASGALFCVAHQLHRECRAPVCSGVLGVCGPPMSLSVVSPSARGAGPHVVTMAAAARACQTVECRWPASSPRLRAPREGRHRAMPCTGARRRHRVALHGAVLSLLANLVLQLSW